MKLKEYVGMLNGLLKEHPEALEYEVISATDEEGNAFFPCWCRPSIGVFYPEEDYYEEDDLEPDQDIDEGFIKAVCVN